MNTLNIIRKQIDKAAALHDAQIAMTTYRGVKFECKSGEVDEVHGTFCYRGLLTISDMQILQITGFVTLFSVAFISLIYGEIKILSK